MGLEIFFLHGWMIYRDFKWREIGWFELVLFFILTGFKVGYAGGMQALLLLGALSLGPLIKWVKGDMFLIGYGDLLLIFIIGFWVPLPYVSSFLILSGLLGMLTGILYQRVTGRKLIPLAPALLLSCWCIDGWKSLAP